MAKNSSWQHILNRNLPFVIYRVPKEEPRLIAQKDKDIRVLSDSSEVLVHTGFAFMPWISSQSAEPLLIKPDIIIEGFEHLSELEQFKQIPPKAQLEFYLSSQQEHRLQVESIKLAIKNGNIEKAILSRIKEVPMLEVSPLDVFKKACTLYPDAFCYLLYTPATGYWMGASPEALLKINGDAVETVALAGTQTDKGKKPNDVPWTAKEKHEHKVVADYIRELMGGHFANVKADGPKTVKAGKVLHLKTIFQAKIEDGTVGDYLEDLNPTPAVAGSPKKEAIELITEIEKHDRSYYTGFLGPVNMNGATHLYVNLRCMQMLPDKMMLYLGGGITAGSDPASEWQETENKAQTIIRLLE
jgi:isochorismate synthase